MSDYISREVILENVLNQMSKSASMLAMSERIKNLQEADVVERKYGKWTFSPEHPIATCSLCGEHKGGKLSPFCPWCGAEMDVSQIYLNLESGDSDV